MSVISNDKPNIVQVSEDNFSVTVISSVGAKGDTGATGATGSSGVAFNTSRISGVYYRANAPAAVTARSFQTTDQTRYAPILIPATTTLDRIGIRSSSTFVGTASVRLGIYSDLNGLPNTVVLDAGLISPNAANTNYEITINQSLSAGFYWLAFNVVTAATTNTFAGAIAAVAGNNLMTMGGYTSLDFGGLAPQLGWSELVSAASNFATAGSLTAIGEIPFVGIRVA